MNPLVLVQVMKNIIERATKGKFAKKESPERDKEKRAPQKSESEKCDRETRDRDDCRDEEVMRDYKSERYKDAVKKGMGKKKKRK